MSNDDEFQLLVSPEDYSLLENKNKALAAQLQILQQELSKLKNALLASKEENRQLQQQNKQKQKQKNYLSVNGLKWARKLLEIEVDNENLKVSCTEKELYFAEQFKESLTSNKKIEQNYNAALKELSKTKADLNAVNEKLMVINKSKQDVALQTKNSDVKNSTVETEMTSASISKLQDKLASLQNELHLEIQKNQLLIIKSTKETSILEQMVTNLEQQNLSYQQTSKDLYKKLEETVIALEDLKKGHEKLEVELIRYKNKQWDAQAQIKEIKKRLYKKMKEEKEKLEQETESQIQALNASHKEQIEKLKLESTKKYEKYEKQSMELIEEKSELIKLLETSEWKIEQVLEQSRKNTSKLSNQMKDLKDRHSKEVEELVMQKNKIKEEYEQSRIKLQTQILETFTENKGLKDNVNSLESAMAKLLKQHQATKIQLQKVFDNSLHQASDLGKQQVQKLLNQKKNLQKQIQNMKRNQEVLCQEYEDIISQFQNNEKNLKATIQKKKQIQIEQAKKVVQTFIDHSCYTLGQIVEEVADFSHKDALALLNEQKEILFKIIDEKIEKFKTKEIKKMNAQHKNSHGRKNKPKNN